MANLEGKAQPQKTDGAATPVSAQAPAQTPRPAPGKKTAKPQQATGGGQKASGAGPASTQVVPNEEAESKPAADPYREASRASGMSAMIGRTKSESAPAAMSKAEHAAKAKAMIADTRAEGVPATATGTVVKKEEPTQPGQPATAQAIPIVQPVDPSVVTGTATMPQKQYGAGDIFNERKSIDEASKQKKAKMLSDFRSGKTTEAEYLKASAEEDKSRAEKKASLDALSKKAESGQFVSQEEMDKATGKATAQPATVQALSATQAPLPEVKPVQPPPPPPVEVPALDKLAKAQEQQSQAQQQNSSKAQDSSGKTGIPNIKTDFDDTMLVLMSYDRT